MHLSSAPTAVVEVGAGGRAARHQYRPAGPDYELDARAGPLDKRLRALAKRGQRELWLVYELSAFDVHQYKGRIFLDYCLADALFRRAQCIKARGGFTLWRSSGQSLLTSSYSSSDPSTISAFSMKS
jgi:hypothetical protein